MLFNVVMQNCFSIFNGVKIYSFEAKEFEIKSHPLCLGNILKGFTVNSMRKNWDIWKNVLFFS